MNNLSTSIATTCEQSERLLAMGVKPETADMYWILDKMSLDMESELSIGKCSVVEDKWTKYTPSWSLSRLISMMPTNINGYILGIDFDNKGIEYSKTNCCDRLEWLYIEGYENLFDGIIGAIDWLIKNNHFN